MTYSEHELEFTFAKNDHVNGNGELLQTQKLTQKSHNVMAVT